MYSVILITFAIIAFFVNQSTQQPSWCDAARNYCTNNINTDPCCTAMWGSALDACAAYNDNNCGDGDNIHPWWCHAAVSYCSNLNPDPCCTTMWGSA